MCWVIEATQPDGRKDCGGRGYQGSVAARYGGQATCTTAISNAP